MSPRNLTSQKILFEMINAVLDKDTGELMEYLHLMKNPKYRQLYGKSYAKELGYLAQGMPGKVEDTNNIFFINKSDIPINFWKDVTYGRVVVKYFPENSIHTTHDSPLVVIESTTLATVEAPLMISSQ